MSELEVLTTPDEVEQIYPVEGRVRSWDYEPEDPEEVLSFIDSVIFALIERVIPEPKRVLTVEKAAKCLSLLGKIWNLTECPEGCEIDSVRCETSDERLLDMEGYVEEYQYLHLEATDLSLSDIRVIPLNFIWLLSVDVSGNRLTNISACPLTKLPNVVSIKLNRNRIEDPYLEPMKHLQYLGMNSNKIYSLHRIYHPNLVTLDLKWNLIRHVYAGDCWKLKNLRQLELRGNQLSTTAGIEYEKLESLYVAENRIDRIEGLNRLTNLRRLHIRKNPLDSLAGFTQANSALEYLNVRSCQLPSVDELTNLKVLTGLRVLVVKDNLFNPSPESGGNRGDGGGDDDDDDDDGDDVAGNDLRIRILQILPWLTRIDKKVVTKEETRSAEVYEDTD